LCVCYVFISLLVVFTYKLLISPKRATGVHRGVRGTEREREWGREREPEREEQLDLFLLFL